MNLPKPQSGQRILVIDDNRAIHEDFRKILGGDRREGEALDQREAILFEDAAPASRRQVFQIDSAFQGQEGLRLLQEALESGDPYAMAFVDVRMAPGWDGVETTVKLWEAYPDLQVVICTAHSDYSWDDMIDTLGYSDRLVILKKPFDNVEVQQLANALTQKWRLLQQAKIKMDDLEKIVGVRTEQFQATNTQLQGEIAERNRAEQALRQQLDRTSLLNHITRAIAERQDMESNFKITLDFLEEHLAIDFSRVYSWDSPAQDLTLIARGQKGQPLAPGPGLPEQTRVPIDQSGLQGCLSGSSIYQPDVTRDAAPLFGLLANEGIGSVLATPLLAENKVFGILVVGRRSVDGFSSAEAEFLSGLSEHISLAAHHARLHADLQSAYDKLRQSQEAIMQQERLAAVGQLSAGVAHDFNNILCIILGYAAMLQDNEDMSQKATDALKQISAAGKRAAHLTRQLLTFSRKQVMQHQTLEFNEVIGNVSRMLQRLVGEDIAVQFHFSTRSVHIHADLGMIEQIVMNLAVNARDAMERGGQLALSAEAVEIDEAYQTNNPEARPGQFACLTVTDSGCGIAPEHLLRIFEPFFTTKPVGKGTGLGLATVYGIVKQHDGWIEVISAVGKGTTFKIFLPRTSKPVGAKTETTFHYRAQSGSERILLVEDEAALRGLASKLLQKQGYQIFEAASGVEALAVWEEHAGAFDLLLTDMVMPGGLSGRALSEKLLAEKPDLKVIFSSGYSTDMVGDNFHLEEEVNFLPKPYPPKSLIQIVRVCLDADKNRLVPAHA